MNAMLLLKNQADSTEAEVRRRLSFERDAKAGCNCDRWGHPRPDCFDDKRKEVAAARIPPPNQVAA